MNIDEAIAALTEVRDGLLIERAQQKRGARVLLTTHHLDGTKTVATQERTSETAEADKLAGASLAITTLHEMLDGWIETAFENHEGSGHRGENRGDECWRRFAPSDIRTMINDAAREMGIGEFPRPEVEKEDTYR